MTAIPSVAIVPPQRFYEARLGVKLAKRIRRREPRAGGVGVAIEEIIALRRNRERLAQNRRSRIPEDEPLVSVIIPTMSRADLLERAVLSALDQDYPRVEVVVIGDKAVPDVADRMAKLVGSRVSFTNLARGWYPENPKSRWASGGTFPLNVGLLLSHGTWIAPLDDDDEFPPDRVRVMLQAAIGVDLEVVYGNAVVAGPQEARIGAFPPRARGITHGAMMYRGDVSFIGYSTESWRIPEVFDWNLMKRFLAIGARVGYLDRTVYLKYE